MLALLLTISLAASVKVTYGKTSKDIELTPNMKLSDVVKPLLGKKKISEIKLSIKADDGFDPATKPKCEKLVPVPGELLENATIDPEKRKLAWNPTLDYPGCMRVHDVTLLTLTDK